MITRRRLLGSAAIAPLVGLMSGRAVGAPSFEEGVGFDPCDFVDPFIGTGGHGHTFPGATVPFGMVQLSPDTNIVGWDACSGYHRDDNMILGFSHTHLSGTGVGDMLDVLIVPAIGLVKLDPGKMDGPHGGYRSRFDRAGEKAVPGYYRVRLTDPDIDVELTATARAGFHRYSFPATGDAHLLIDLRHEWQELPGPETRISEASFRLIGDDIVVGGRRVHQWADGRVIYFALKLSRPFVRADLYRNERPMPEGTRVADGADLKCALHFSAADPGPLLVKVGLSSVDIDGALANLDREIPDWDFDRVRGEAHAAWKSELSRMIVRGGDPLDRRIFYTSLYHAMLAPTLFCDVDGRYRAMDGTIRHLPAGSHNYSTYSLWDTYRALHPLLTLIQPERAADMVRGLARMSEESPSGPPIWPLQGVETFCMVGWHSAVVLAEACAKGLPGLDYQAVWQTFRFRAFEDSAVSGLDEYRRRGYVSCDVEENSVSKTLEFAYDDWAMATLADAAGAKEDAALLRQRSLNYRNLFDAKSGFMRPRLKDGGWAEPFDPRAVGHGRQWTDFKECNAWQATFLNQHDLYRYMDAFGGADAFERALDELFTTSSELPEDAPPDIAGLVGQYAHGNEPSHHIAYLYAFTGAPHKAQARLRSLMKTMYRAEPDGLAGNEDCGQMSAWYLMSALGLYAVDPVTPIYVFGAPLFPRVDLAVAPGRVLTIEAPGNQDDHPYIQSVRWNAKPYHRTWISHADLIRGGHLSFKMGPSPNQAYGSAPSDRPPSFGAGI